MPRKLIVGLVAFLVLAGLAILFEVTELPKKRRFWQRVADSLGGTLGARMWFPFLDDPYYVNLQRSGLRVLLYSTKAGHSRSVFDCCVTLFLDHQAATSFDVRCGFSNRFSTAAELVMTVTGTPPWSPATARRFDDVFLGHLGRIAAKRTQIQMRWQDDWSDTEKDDGTLARLRIALDIVVELAQGSIELRAASTLDR